MTDKFQLIKDSVTMRQVAEHYSYAINHASKICCPFHKEKTASLKIYDGNRGYHCFGCGESGSVIDFVAKHEGVEPLEAVNIIANIFMIDIQSNKPMPEFDRLRFDIKRLTKELADIEKQGKADIIHNQIIKYPNSCFLDLPLKNLDAARENYKKTLLELNSKKERLFGGRFDKEITNYFQTNVIPNANKELEALKQIKKSPIEQWVTGVYI